MSFDQKLLEKLACPRCPERPSLELADDKGLRLRCTVCRWEYSVEGGIPNLLPDEAHPPGVHDDEQPQS